MPHATVRLPVVLAGRSALLRTASLGRVPFEHADEEVDDVVDGVIDVEMGLEPRLATEITVTERAGVDESADGGFGHVPWYGAPRL